MFPPGFAGRDGEPLPLIVRKSDGGYGYAATDLAAIRHRTGTLGATRLLYVVGLPQRQHFEMVYAVAAQAGWLTPPARAEHVGFGSILGPDGRMLRSRAGDSVKLVELLDEAVARATALARQRNPELGEAEAAEVGRAVGIGAVKYADLSSDRHRDYVLDWDRMLSLDGNTAPYLQYAYARIRSIFRRAGVAARPDAAISLADPAERALAFELVGFAGGGRRGGREPGVPPARRLPVPAGRRVQRVLRALPGAAGRRGRPGEPAGALRPDRPGAAAGAAPARHPDPERM